MIELEKLAEELDKEVEKATQNYGELSEEDRESVTLALEFLKYLKAMKNILEINRKDSK